MAEGPIIGALVRSKAPSRGLWMRQAGSLWQKRAGVAIPRIKPRHRGGPLCCLYLVLPNSLDLSWCLYCHRHHTHQPGQHSVRRSVLG